MIQRAEGTLRSFYGCVLWGMYGIIIKISVFRRKGESA